MVKSTAAAPAMSPFISHMWSPGLRLMPPESKVMPLPTSAMVSADSLRGMWRRMTMRGGWGLPWPTRSMPCVAARLEAGRVEDLDLQPDLLRDLAGALGDDLRRHHRARLVDEVARLVHVLGDPRVARLARLRVGLVVGVADDRELRLPLQELVLLLLVAVEGVRAQHRALHHLAHQRRARPPRSPAPPRARSGSRAPGAARGR